MPNPWDPGSAKVLAAAGFEALATTSSGSAGALGRTDGALVARRGDRGRGGIVAATDLPVSADMEHCFGDDAAGVAETVDLGGRRRSGRVLHRGLRPGRASRSSRSTRRPSGSPPSSGSPTAGRRVVVTARAENHIRGRHDLDDTIARLQAYAAAGADAVFAPGLPDLDGDRPRRPPRSTGPLNVLYRPDGPSVAELAGAGVARLSVGGSSLLRRHGRAGGRRRGLRADRAGYGDQLAAGFAAVKAARVHVGDGGRGQHVTSRGGTMPSVCSAGRARDRRDRRLRRIGRAARSWRASSPSARRARGASSLAGRGRRSRSGGGRRAERLLRGAAPSESGRGRGRGSAACSRCSISRIEHLGAVDSRPVASIW